MAFLWHIIFTTISGRQLFERNSDLASSDAAFAEEGEAEINIDWNVFRKELDALQNEIPPEDDEDANEQ